MGWRIAQSVRATKRRAMASRSRGRWAPWGKRESIVCRAFLARRYVLVRADYLRLVWCCLVASEDSAQGVSSRSLISRSPFTFFDPYAVELAIVAQV